VPQVAWLVGVGGGLVAAAVPVGAGFLLDRTGYAGMLCGLALAMGGVFVFALRGSGAIGRTAAPG
jgi:PAT family beta-lactamase induction signal transducer AmpG